MKTKKENLLKTDGRVFNKKEYDGLYKEYRNKLPPELINTAINRYGTGERANKQLVEMVILVQDFKSLSIDAVIGAINEFGIDMGRSVLEAMIKQAKKKEGLEKW